MPNLNCLLVGLWSDNILSFYRRLSHNSLSFQEPKDKVTGKYVNINWGWSTSYIYHLFSLHLSRLWGKGVESGYCNI